jgi:hypothetical protein
MSSMTDKGSGREPSAADLAAIEAEWPQIEADLAVLEGEIRGLVAADRVDELEVRRVRRAGRRVLRPVAVHVVRFGGDAA